MEQEQPAVSAKEQVKTYYMRCASGILVLVLLGLGAAGVMTYTLLGSTHPHWPFIRDPDALVRDCKVMMLRYTGNVNQNEWPQSVKALNPVALKVENNHSVLISISLGGVWGKPWGYLIVDKPGVEIGSEGYGMKVLTTDDARIYKCD